MCRNDGNKSKFHLGRNEERNKFDVVCYHVFLNSLLLSKNVNIKVRTSVILYVVLYGSETWYIFH
jgi:hypothetical protein